jgi:hypothetical protein
VAKLHNILTAEDHRPHQRDNELAHFRGFDSPAWLLVGQSGVVEYLMHWPQDAASQYMLEHPPSLPYYAKLDDARRETSVTITRDTADMAADSTSSNPLVETNPVDVVMTANVDNDPLTEVPLVTKASLPYCRLQGEIPLALSPLHCLNRPTDIMICSPLSFSDCHR